MKKKLGFLFAMCLTLLLVLPASVFAATVDVNLYDSLNDKMLTVSIYAYDETHQPSSEAPTAVKATLMSGSPGSYVYQTVYLTLTSSNPSQGLYVYTSNTLPSGWTVIEIAANFSMIYAGKSANYPIT
ncbi:hypothetical protein PCCS19_34700 [Paenibacillus sp. CCS19]|uniref:hypothetical protein n=1 Tax=Paenibacillus sp. CCS19 TaxID=3158387 RepID=UPI002569057B|nr:hypothetical protein [Paenibacillus cellulosilyticus]GMK40414.1 hypothetical protein PCCS19_34700 [Paenibacillus cellulosilyticus]